MSDVLKYKGFAARIEFSADRESFSGRVIRIEDNVTFSGSSVRELKKAMKDAVDIYVEKCRKKGRDARKTYSGKLLFRFSPELHAGIADAAAVNSQSINEYGREIFEAALRQASAKEAKRKAAGGRGKR